jgi:hypothetical protein
MNRETRVYVHPETGQHEVVKLSLRSVTHARRAAMAWPIVR